jgi:crotonobetainyl-CoA:carnitine CoA-transferase CaiB-like acyl-CoA transferase
MGRSSILESGTYHPGGLRMEASSLAHSILALGGRAPHGDDDLAFGAGGDPVYPTPLRIALAASAALGAVGMALSDVWRLRTGRRQAVRVEPRAAAASLKSSAYATLDGEKAKIWDPLTGHYRTRDSRHIFLHTNHPHHRAAALRIACAAGQTRADLEAAVAKLDAGAFETALAAEDGIGAVVRTRAEWSALPHARALAALPLFEIDKIGDARPEPLPEAARPLAGLRVLDLTRVLAGPAAGRMLAEHGAEVLHLTAPHIPYQTELLYDTGPGKRCAWLDLDTQDGPAALRGLATRADVFLQSYRPEALAKRGFGAGHLAKLRPGIVVTTLSAYGHAGPWALRRGFDSVVQNAMGLATSNSSLASPKNMPVQALDYIGGYLAALGTILALTRRAREGGSWRVRVSLAQVAHWLAGLGTIDAAGAPADPPAAELAALMTEIASPFGRVGHFKPVLELSETQGFYATPPEPFGSSPASWR